jgi:hypothetical protein
MNSKAKTLRYDLTHCYLELARTGTSSAQQRDPKVEQFLEQHGPDPLANIVFSMISMTVIYSALAIEAAVNYRLYFAWLRYRAGLPPATRFEQEFGAIDDFERIRSARSGRNLGHRVKALCRVCDFRLPHEAIPDVWQNFKELVETSRHFLVHPHPGSSFFQEHMETILKNTRTGKYISVAAEMIGFFYDQAGESRPDWIAKSTLFRFASVDILYKGESNAG